MHHVKTYTISLIPTESGYRAVCQGVPGCEAAGRSREEALESIEDRIRALIADATVRGRPVPVDRTSTKFLWINTDEFIV
jgi:predicted RNase H-like HicB family nuclease